MLASQFDASARKCKSTLRKRRTITLRNMKAMEKVADEAATVFRSLKRISAHILISNIRLFMAVMVVWNTRWPLCLKGPSLGTAIHEWMHSWYQMMLGTNESLYAWMDEGFTTSYAGKSTIMAFSGTTAPRWPHAR